MAPETSAFALVFANALAAAAEQPLLMCQPVIKVNELMRLQRQVQHLTPAQSPRLEKTFGGVNIAATSEGQAFAITVSG